MPEFLSETDSFPITSKAFLTDADKYLKRGDIILSRSPTFMSWLIRRTTGSRFSHAALVFFVAQPEEGYASTFLLESVRSGVGLANLRDYIAGRNPKAEIAVLRLADPTYGDMYFKDVRGLMLDHVKSGYDFTIVWRLGLSAVFGMRLSWARLRLGKATAMQDAMARTKARVHKWVPPQFICSGFIQYGFVKAAVRAGLPMSPVIFRSGLDERSGNALLAVTPEELATSPNLRWLLVARRGWVYRAESRNEGEAIISGAKQRTLPLPPASGIFRHRA